MATTKFDIKTEATKTLYAGAGVVDLGVEVVKDAYADAQKRFSTYQKDVSGRVADVQKSFADFDLKSFDISKVELPKVEFPKIELPKVELPKVDVKSFDLKTVTADAKAFPAKFQTLVNENVASATDTYEDLAKRGETLVGKIRRQEPTKTTKSAAKQTVSSAKATTTTAKKAAKKTVPAAKRTTTSAKKTASSAARAAGQAATKVGS